MKISKLILIVFFTQITSTGLANDKVDKVAAKADGLGDFHTNPLYINGANVKVTSYFDMTSHRAAIEQALSPKADGSYDVRAAEKIYCRLAKNSMPFLARYRGTFGFVAGVALAGSAAAATILMRSDKIKQG